MISENGVATLKAKVANPKQAETNAVRERRNRPKKEVIPLTLP